jgi:hypothetical protein
MSHDQIRIESQRSIDEQLTAAETEHNTKSGEQIVSLRKERKGMERGRWEGPCREQST